MEKQFKNLTEITERHTYDAASKYLDEIVDYATRNGYFKDPGADNEYTREFERIAGMCADYESVYMDLSPLKFKKPLPISRKQPSGHSSASRERRSSLC
ncbi:hypothetical protein [Leadbetterella sp. DM7]|uniref:hypothetical protein n=1 Tax=Leadbetterella sp. DM7 TaxID=3235085 RepID=UPI00349F03DF